MNFRIKRNSLYCFVVCCLLLSGAESLRPWGARSVNNALALLAQLEPIKSVNKSSQLAGQNPIALLNKKSDKVITQKLNQSKKPTTKSPAIIALPASLFVPQPYLPPPIAVQAVPKHLGAAVIGPLSLADLDSADPVVPSAPPAAEVLVRLPVLGLCRRELVKLQVERMPGGALRGEPRWIGAKPSLALERRLQAWLDQPIPGAPSRQQLVIDAVPLRQDRKQVGANCT